MAASVGTSSKSISGFDPRSLSGCVLWLDADDPYTLFSDAGGTTLATTTVNAWKDKSASALLFAGGTSGPTLIKSTTVNSRPYLSFNGTSNYLLNTSMSVSQPYTIYVVGYATASAASTYYRILHGLSAGSVNFNLVIGALAGNVAMFIGNASSWNDVNAIVPATTSINVWVIYSATVTGGTLNSFLNGTACTSKTGNIASTISGFNIGGGQSSTGYSTTQPFQGYVGEILMYNYVLSASQRQQVEGYLAWKWGMTSSSITKPTVITLPVSHSFSITKPHSRQFNLVDTPNLSTTPTNIPGCILWLDGKDTNTYSTTVTTWTDKSGKGNTATSAGTAGTITTSATGLVFGGAGYMTVPGIAGSIANTPFVIFMVETVTSAGYFFGDDNVNNGGTTDSSLHVGYRSLTNHTFAFYSNDLEDYAVSGSGAMRLWCFYLPISSNRVTRRNGAIDVIRPNYNRLQFFTAPRIGRVFGGAYYTGTISELLVYPLDIGISAIQQIEGYLAWKWNIILSSSHQYYGYKIIQSLPFYPTNLPGCLLWLDGNDPAGTGTKPAAGTLATWVDKSGSGYNATAAVAATYIPSTGALNFTGTQSYTTTLPSYLISQSGFAVIRFSGATKMDIIALTQTVGAKGGLQQIIQNSQQIITTYDGTIIVQASTTLAENTILLYNYTFDISRGAYIYYNGTQTATTNPPYLFTNFNATINIGGYNGASEPFIGNIYEIILYNTSLSTNQRQQVEAYLAAKWGFLLPLNHSYYKFAPAQLAPPVSSTFSSSFTPGGIISGVKVWLDASDPTTLYLNQGTTLATLGGPVAYWRDKSGSANHYTQTTAANQPIYSNIGGVLFPATNVVAVLINSSVWAGTSGYDVFCVSKPHSSTATGTWRTLLRGSGNDHPVLIEAGTTRIGAYNNAFGFYPFGSLTMDGSARTLLYVSISATNTYSAAINGTIALSAATAALQNNNFGSVGNNYGGYQPWGEINELMIVPNCTTAQRQTIEGYLAAKWGLQTSLPVAQPYYSFSPTPMIAISGTTLTATWATSPDVFSYNVILYSQSTVGGALTSVSNVFQSTISKTYTVTAGLIYTVYVSVVDSAGISSVPAVSNSLPCLSAPVFTVSSITGTTFNFTVTAQLGGTLSYRITPSSGTTLSGNSFTGLAAGTTYFVTATISATSVTSISTNSTSYSTPLNAPTAFSITSMTDTTVTFQWTKSTSTVSKHTLTYGSSTVDFNEPNGATTYTLNTSGLTNNSNYQCYVTATNSGVISSATASKYFTNIKVSGSTVDFTWTPSVTTTYRIGIAGAAGQGNPLGGGNGGNGGLLIVSRSLGSGITIKLGTGGGGTNTSGSGFPGIPGGGYGYGGAAGGGGGYTKFDSCIAGAGGGAGGCGYGPGASGGGGAGGGNTGGTGGAVGHTENLYIGYGCCGSYQCVYSEVGGGTGGSQGGGGGGGGSYTTDGNGGTQFANGNGGGYLQGGAGGNRGGDGNGGGGGGGYYGGGGGAGMNWPYTYHAGGGGGGGSSFIGSGYSAISDGQGDGATCQSGYPYIGNNGYIWIYS